LLAANAKLRTMVVPQGPEDGADAAQPAACEANSAHHRPARMSWAKLLKRVFELDLEHCPNCGGELKSIATILEGGALRILTRLGLQARAPPRAPARGQALQAACPRPNPSASKRPGAKAAGCVWGSARQAEAARSPGLTRRRPH